MEVINEAVKQYKPVRIYALFSGGADSLAATDFAMEHCAQEVAHINTGIGVDESKELSVREYVFDTCRERGWPVREWHPPDLDYRAMVMKYGFPGPGAHLYPYSWLKERAIAMMVRIAKVSHRRNATVILSTGVRNTESARRMGFVKPIHKAGARIWTAPLFDHNKIQQAEYLKQRGLKVSNIVKLIGMSGECFCGAFAEKKERLVKIAPHFPKLNQKIADLEAEAVANGVRDSIWGVRPRKNRKNLDLPFMPLCINCHGGTQASHAHAVVR